MSVENGVIAAHNAATILSGSAVHVKAPGLVLVSAMKRLIAASRSTTEWNTPSLSRFRASVAKKSSSALSHRIHDDKGYRGHSCANKFRVWTSGQLRRVTKTIYREMKRRAAIEPVLGRLKAEHRMERNYLKGRDGDRANAVLAAAGYNSSLLLRWFETFFRALIAAIFRTPPTPQTA